MCDARCVYWTMRRFECSLLFCAPRVLIEIKWSCNILCFLLFALIIHIVFSNSVFQCLHRAQLNKCMPMIWVNFCLIRSFYSIVSCFDVYNTIALLRLANDTVRHQSQHTNTNRLFYAAKIIHLFDCSITERFKLENHRNFAPWKQNPSKSIGTYFNPFPFASI